MEHLMEQIGTILYSDSISKYYDVWCLETIRIPYIIQFFID